MKAFFVVRITNYWGKGETLSDAIKNTEKASGKIIKKGQKYQLSIVAKENGGMIGDIWIDDMGDLHWLTNMKLVYSGMETR